MTVQDEKWGLSSGLPLADVDAEISAFNFGFNANIGPGIVCANITFTTLEDGEAHEQSFSVGDGWDVAGKGASITGRKKLSNQTNWGRLVQSMVAACDGAEGISSKLPNADYREAAGWIGSKWHLGTVEVTSKNPTTGVEKATSKIVATAFLGVDGDVSAAATRSPAAAKKQSGKSLLSDANPELFAELLELANGYADHDDFMAAALEWEAVEGDSTAMNAVMSVKAGSVWAAK